jgi:hypothetical protein
MISFISNLPELGKHISAVPLVTASGQLVACVFLVPGSPALEPSFDAINDYPQFKVFTTSSGFMDGPTMTKTYRFFVSQLFRVRPSPDRHIVFLFDNLKCHINNSEDMGFLLDSNVHCVSFPPNSTEVLQPLDLHPNSSFKAHNKVWFFNEKQSN